MASVSFRNIKKAFLSTPVIHNVDFDIADGEFMVLVGPSGCGKSTLLRMLAGLELVTEGDVAIDGRVVNNVESKDRDIAMVFQSYALYPHMTVRENMAFSLMLRKASAETTLQRVRDAARMLNLDGLLERYPRELSGGQRQRVAMGRAIVRNPKVFLFDEPLSNLDAKLRVAMRTEIKALHQRLKTTTIYVTHDQVEAMTMADRIAVMNAGLVEQIGTPLDLYDRPANQFVAEFIGSPAMNIIRGTAHRDSDDMYIRSPDGRQWPLLTRRTLQDGAKISYGVRPEHLVFVDSSAKSAMDAEVIVVEPTGASTEVVVRIGSSTMTMSTTGRPSITPGDRVHLAPQLEKVHLFDSESGVRLSD